MTWKVPRMVWWYWALIDAMVAHPEKTKKDFAKEFNVSYTCLCLIASSDVFQAHLQERRSKISADIDGVIKHKLTAVATTSLELIQDRLEKKRDAIPLDELKAIADMGLEKLGYGLKGSASVVINNTNSQQNVVVPVSLSQLEDARSALRAVELKKIEAPQKEIGSDHTYPYREREREQPEPVFAGHLFSPAPTG